MNVKNVYFRKQQAKAKARAIREFAGLEPLQDPKPDIIHLQCDTCFTEEVRNRCVVLTGHVHDMTCTYVCTCCRGIMREITNLNPNQNEEK